MTTKDKLFHALVEAHAPSYMLEKARHGDYDDFESESATPIYDLVSDLRRAHLPELMGRAMDGEFDATKEEAEAWFKKEGARLLDGPHR